MNDNKFTAAERAKIVNFLKGMGVTALLRGEGRMAMPMWEIAPVAIKEFIEHSIVVRVSGYIRYGKAKM